MKTFKIMVTVYVPGVKTAEEALAELRDCLAGEIYGLQLVMGRELTQEEIDKEEE